MARLLAFRDRDPGDRQRRAPPSTVQLAAELVSLEHTGATSMCIVAPPAQRQGTNHGGDRQQRQ
ncbi:MAG TPA: hypothetical protein VL220_07260 [Steroidobacteraceae bacterium]|nr:hypothetical protein [Steroidobacteraceae bacterium]